MKPLREWIRNLFNEAPPQKFLFRVDAGRIPGLSFGHLARCLILSDVFRELYQSENLFLMRNYDEGIRHALQTGETVKEFSKTFTPIEEQTYIFNVVRKFEPDWMVIDLPYPDMDTSYFPILRSQGIKLFFIDDFRFVNPGVDVLLNSSVLASEKVRKSFNGFTQYLLGSEFFIFYEFHKDISPIRKEGAFNVVLTFGGSDPTDLTKKVLKSLAAEQWQDIFFQIILGPGYADICSIRHLVEKRGKEFEVVVNPSNIIPFFQGSDITVCAGGRTMYELLHLNKKFLPVASTEIEAEAIAEFVRQGIVDFGMTNWQPEKFINTMKKMCLPSEKKD